MGSLAPPLSATTESFGRHEVNGPTAGGKERGEGDGPGEGDGEGDGAESHVLLSVLRCVALRDDVFLLTVQQFGGLVVLYRCRVRCAWRVVVAC